jgi:hypothetical protein
MGMISGLMELKFFYLVLIFLGLSAVIAAIFAWRQDYSYRKGAALIKGLLEDNARLKQEAMDLRLEVGRLKEDSAVKTQMYGGLKEQYDELEKDFEKLNAGKL